MRAAKRLPAACDQNRRGSSPVLLGLVENLFCPSECTLPHCKGNPQRLLFSTARRRSLLLSREALLPAVRLLPVSSHPVTVCAVAPLGESCRRAHVARGRGWPSPVPRRPDVGAVASPVVTSRPCGRAPGDEGPRSGVQERLAGVLRNKMRPLRARALAKVVGADLRARGQQRVAASETSAASRELRRPTPERSCNRPALKRRMKNNGHADDAIESGEGQERSRGGRKEARTCPRGPPQRPQRSRG